MACFNSNLVHRPLRAGCSLINPLVSEAGTLGLIATTGGSDRWIVSCYHVLCRTDMSDANDLEPIFQPSDDADNLVALIDLNRTDKALDCAAALVQDGIKCSGETIGLPVILGVSEPVIGMRVIKSGCTSGITEGLIADVQGDKVWITIPPFFPAKSQLTEPGDSGSLWVDRLSMRAVAMHQTGSAFGATSARGVRISAVLSILRLQPIFQ